MKKTTVYIIIIVVFVLIIIGYLLYNAGKKTRPKVKYPNGGQGIPAGWSPTPLVEQLFKTMDGMNVNRLSRDAAWMDLSKLPSDDMVVSVYDVFNQLYFKDSQETLTEWIKNESTLGWVSTAKNAALNRLASLNLE